MKMLLHRFSGCVNGTTKDIHLRHMNIFSDDKSCKSVNEV